MTRSAKVFSVILSALLLAGPSVCLCKAAETAHVEKAKAESCCHDSADAAGKAGHARHSKDCPHCSVRISGTLDTPRADVASARDFALAQPLPPSSGWVLPGITEAATFARALGPPPLLPLTLEQLHVSLLL